jgi:hypothetical protein
VHNNYHVTKNCQAGRPSAHDPNGDRRLVLGERRNFRVRLCAKDFQTDVADDLCGLDRGYRPDTMDLHCTILEIFYG